MPGLLDADLWGNRKPVAGITFAIAGDREIDSQDKRLVASFPSTIHHLFDQTTVFPYIQLEPLRTIGQRGYFLD